MRFADVDAVTVDAYGTLLRLRDPVPRLRRSLADHGVERGEDVVARAFQAEVAYYSGSQRAANAASLRELRERCTKVFLDAAGAAIEPKVFAPAFVDALVFETLPGAMGALDELAARGLALALVANWDVSLRDHLGQSGLARRFAAVVISAEVGAAKPDPRPFEVALATLGVTPERAVHVGDDKADEQGAAAAGLRFLPAPLEHAFAGWM
jgi:putative hydrolase of the HAD superfamily